MVLEQRQQGRAPHSGAGIVQEGSQGLRLPSGAQCLPTGVGHRGVGLPCQALQQSVVGLGRRHLGQCLHRLETESGFAVTQQGNDRTGQSGRTAAGRPPMRQDSHRLDPQVQRGGHLGRPLLEPGVARSIVHRNPPERPSRPRLSGRGRRILRQGSAQGRDHRGSAPQQRLLGFHLPHRQRRIEGRQQLRHRSLLDRLVRGPGPGSGFGSGLGSGRTRMRDAEDASLADPLAVAVFGSVAPAPSQHPQGPIGPELQVGGSEE